MTDMVVALFYIGMILLGLGVCGGVLTLVFSLPTLDKLFDLAFQNVPLGRKEVQQLNREEQTGKSDHKMTILQDVAKQVFEK